MSEFGTDEPQPNEGDGDAKTVWFCARSTVAERHWVHISRAGLGVG